MIKKYSIMGFCVFSIFSCINEKNDTEIVFKIEKLEISRYQFERELKRTLSETELQNESIVSSWKENYVDKCFITAYGYEKRYDTLPKVISNIEKMADHMMVQRYGYLWKEIISPIVDSFKIPTSEKCNKHSKLYYFDIIESSSDKELRKLMGNDTIIARIENFNSLKSKCNNNGALKSYYVSIQWPFTTYWPYREYLYSLKPGEFSKLIEYNNKYFYFYLDYIEEIKLNDEDKMNLLSELQMGIELDLDRKKDMEIITKCRPSIDSVNVELLMSYIRKEEIEESEIQDKILVRFTLDGEKKEILGRDFLDYYCNLPFFNKKDVQEISVLYNGVNQFFFNTYLMDEARKLGLYGRQTFLLDKNIYQNNVVYQTTINKEIYNYLIVDTLEMLNYYQTHLNDFSYPQKMKLIIFKFSQAYEAYAIKNSLIGYNLSDPSIIKELKNKYASLNEIMVDYEIDMRNNVFPENFVEEALNSQINILTENPLKYNDDYILMYKTHESEFIPKEFYAVSTEIHNILRDQEATKKRQELIALLKKKYKIEIDKIKI